MPGGKYDSSKTRVGPVFDRLWSRGRDWLPDLLALPTGGCPEAKIGAEDLTLLEHQHHWEPSEKCLNPPVSLLSWLIRNAGFLSAGRMAFRPSWVPQAHIHGMFRGCCLLVDRIIYCVEFRNTYSYDFIRSIFRTYSDNDPHGRTRSNEKTGVL